MLLSLDFPSGSAGLYGSNKAAMLDGLYAQIGHTYTFDTSPVDLVIDPDGISGGRVFYCYPNVYGGGSNLATMREVLANGATQTVSIASRIRLTNLPQASDQVPLIAVWKDGSNGAIVTLGVTTTGQIAAYTGPPFDRVQIGITSVPVITANSWIHVEGRLKASTTGTGELTVWVEGEERLALTGLTLSSATTSQIERGVDPSNTGANPGVYFKDLVLSDSTGTVNNGQIGPLVVLDLTENGDISTGWTNSSGSTNFSLVDEAGPPNDGGYIAAADPPPAPSIMTLTNLPEDIVGVRGLMTFVRARKIDSGDGTLVVGLTPDGVDYDNGTDKVLTTSFRYYKDISELSPDTSAPWTPVEVNNARIRINRAV